tara:strand:- start:419 stop:547 length:129 start_codon:yes stop_codon:yes gene_type:complete
MISKIASAQHKDGLVPMMGAVLWEGCNSPPEEFKKRREKIWK